MQPIELILLLVMVVYAVFRQTRAGVAGGPRRFRLAFIYAGLGLASLLVGGWDPPEGIGWAFLIGGVVLSVVVGVLRGRHTRVWIAADGTRMRRGTWLTVTLFVTVIAVKVALGAIAGLAGIADGASFAEVLLIVAIMIAVQAEIVHRRALVLAGRDPDRPVGADRGPTAGPQPHLEAERRETRHREDPEASRPT
ncbi:hypothetical protein [Agromyces sp. Marseille-Q5079]|uniref:hypothetical protein n=1 Tax=Agromyces sp. Marseille-Q5079 TaxID=3439059 RepID=UPI003D9CBE69